MSPRSTSESDQARDGDDRREQGKRGAAAHAAERSRGRVPRRRSTLAPVSTKPAVPSRADGTGGAGRGHPFRAAVPASRAPRSSRSSAGSLSVAALVMLDLAGLVFGIYVALILRELYLGEWPPLWGILWDTETDWLPFLTVITVLVFWVGGLYRRRESRSGLGQIVVLAGARRRDHARVRPRHRLPLHDVRPDADGARADGALHRRCCARATTC